MYFPLLLKPVGTMVVVDVNSCRVGYNGLLAVREKCGLNELWDMVLKMRFLPSCAAATVSSQLRGALLAFAVNTRACLQTPNR